MPRKLAFLMLLALAVLAANCSPSPKGKSDLDAYIEEIRASGMSEMAKNSIEFMASLCEGTRLLEFRPDSASGRYFPGYTNTTCSLPDAGKQSGKGSRETEEAKSDRLVKELKRLADTDNSGFVTTKEGFEFRYLIEYGYLAAQVIKDEGASLESIARASGKDVKDAEVQLARYSKSAQELREAGVAELPSIELAESRP